MNHFFLIFVDIETTLYCTLSVTQSKDKRRHMRKVWVYCGHIESKKIIVAMCFEIRYKELRLVLFSCSPEQPWQKIAKLFLRNLFLCKYNLLMPVHNDNNGIKHARRTIRIRCNHFHSVQCTHNSYYLVWDRISLLNPEYHGLQYFYSRVLQTLVKIWRNLCQSFDSTDY